MKRFILLLTLAASPLFGMLIAVGISHQVQPRQTVGWDEVSLRCDYAEWGIVAGGAVGAVVALGAFARSARRKTADAASNPWSQWEPQAAASEV